MAAFVTQFFEYFREADPIVQASVLVVLLGAFTLQIYLLVRGWYVRRELRRDRDRAKEAAQEAALQAERHAAEAQKSDQQVGRLESKLQDAQESVGREEERRRELEESLEQAGTDLERAQKEIVSFESRFDALGKLDAGIWAEHAPNPATTPAFVPGPARRARLVAFLNIKGGVGKTTLTANLATAYSTGVTGTPLRTLVVDLDHQGTLSNMCLGTETLDYLRKNGFTSEQLLCTEQDEPDVEALLSQLASPVEQTDGLTQVIAARDDLEHLDFRMQATFSVARAEVRFCHRRVLQAPEVTGEYDLVFFDCPPRLTASTINALMACDYVVVPTALHPNDVDAVPRTLRWLEKLAHLNEYRAEVAGVVLNRTYHRGSVERLTKVEQLQFARLEAEIQRYLPHGNTVFHATVGKAPEVERYAAGSVPLGTSAEGRELYADVACELWQRLGG